MEGSQLRKIRLHMALTQEQFAKQLGVRPNTVARWERNERRISKPVALLATLLGKLTSQKGR
jgi:DNA-binding transcriptional regulator YiaG